MTELLGEIYSLDEAVIPNLGEWKTPTDRAFYLLYRSAVTHGFVSPALPGDLLTPEKIRRVLRTAFNDNPFFLVHLYLFRTLSARDFREAQSEFNTAAKWARWAKEGAEHPGAGEAQHSASLRDWLDYSFILRVSGMTFEPYLHDGEMVFVKDSRVANDGDLVFARMTDPATGEPYTICRRMEGPEGFPELRGGEATISGIAVAKLVEP